MTASIILATPSPRKRNNKITVRMLAKLQTTDYANVNQVTLGILRTNTSAQPAALDDAHVTHSFMRQAWGCDFGTYSGAKPDDAGNATQPFNVDVTQTYDLTGINGGFWWIGLQDPGSEALFATRRLPILG